MVARRVRRASRVLLVDAAGRVLLMHARGWWFSVGGGIDAGETPVQAALREVAEETGVRLDAEDLGPVVLRTTTVLPWDDGADVEQHDEFRVARLDARQVERAGTDAGAGLTPLELATVDGLRWWSPAELRAATDPVAPAGLADLLDAQLAASR